MSRTIRKATLRPTYLQKVLMPTGAKVISVMEQQNEIVLYYLCSPIEAGSKVHEHDVASVATGEDVPDWASTENFSGTVNLNNGALMYHVFVK